MNRNIVKSGGDFYVEFKKDFREWENRLRISGIEYSIKNKVLYASLEKRDSEGHRYLRMEIQMVGNEFKASLRNLKGTDEIGMNPNDAIQTFIAFKTELSD